MIPLAVMMYLRFRYPRGIVEAVMDRTQYQHLLFDVRHWRNRFRRMFAGDICRRRVLRCCRSKARSLLDGRASLGQGR